MPVRSVPLETGECYHLFNRGVAKMPIFAQDRHYRRFLQTLRFYQRTDHTLRYSHFLNRTQGEQLAYLEKTDATQMFVTVLAYVLMPNHYHVLVKQEVDGGISSWLGLVSNSYTRYFNTVAKRVGPLFQGPFKAVHVDSDAQLMHVSRYIHRNPLEAGLVDREHLPTYPWSSIGLYLNADAIDPSVTVKTDLVLDHFRDVDDYRSYLSDSSDIFDGNTRHAPLLLDNDT